MARMVVVAVLAALVAVGAISTTRPDPVAAGASSVSPRAVIIVGPSGKSTSDYLKEGELLADQAEDAGMGVTRIFHPRATWQRVVESTRGAHFVVYFGHGNGWPSPYPPFQENTKDGFGLNAYEGAPSGSHVYYGGNRIREKIRLAENAVVMIYRACYAAGNGEDSQPIPSRAIATERVDNFSAAFLANRVGAGVVMAYRTKQWVNFPAQLMKPHKTMDDVFQTRSSQPGWRMSGWMGEILYQTDSDRTDGARIRLDQHPSGGYSRAITGDLGLTTDEWLGAAQEPDATAPDLTDVTASAGGDVEPAGGDSTVAFSPNGDGIDETVTLEHRVSEGAWVDVDVTDSLGTVVRRLSAWSEAGLGMTTWNGRDDEGAAVPDGTYRLSVTARDSSDNRSGAVPADVRALSVLRAPAWDAEAFNGTDGDSLAATAAFDVELMRAATVSLRIKHADGGMVRTLQSDAAFPAGTFGAAWDGRDDQGAAVEDGRYFGVVTATTEAGSVTHRLKVWHGPFRLRASDKTPSRGQRVRFTVLATEPLAADPRLTIKQPGVNAFYWNTAKVGPNEYQAWVTLRSGGRAGMLQVTVTGRDVASRSESYLKSFELR